MATKKKKKVKAKPASKKATKKTAQRAAAKKTASKKTAKKAATATKKSATPKAAKTAAVTMTSLLGQTLPSFELPSTSGGSVSLDGLRGKKVVLYFYPKDATPGCTIEGHDFSKLLPDFEREGAVVYGISRDTLDSHQSFKEKECFDFDLLSDTDETVCKIFDVIKEKNMYGKKMMGIERSTFVIDPSGRVAAEWRKVSVDGHAQEVLEKIKAIS